MKSTSPPDGLGSRVIAFMGAVHRHDAGRTAPILHRSKLTTLQLAVLERTRSPRTVSEVATWVGLSRPATSQMIDKLVGAGLVRRYESQGDRRERNVVVTAKGAALVRRIAGARAARFDDALARLPKALAERLANVLEDVVASLGESEPSPDRGAS